MLLKKENSPALIGTLVVHGIILLILLYLGLTTPLPIPPEIGVEIEMGGGGVNYGNNENGLGENPIEPNKNSQMIAQNIQPEDNQEKDIENNDEESVNLKKEVKKKVEKKKVEKKIEVKKEVVTPKKEEKKQQVIEQTVNNFALYKKNSSQGITTNGGDQGNETGDLNNPNYKGSGKGKGNGNGNGDGDNDGDDKGNKKGISFNLSGRSAKFLPKPAYNSNAQGRVVVTITVDKEGNVTKAIAGAKGTQTSDISLWKAAEQAALKAKFELKGDAPEEQKGSITYNFIKLN